MIEDIRSYPYLVGTKQTMRAIEEGDARIVFLAKDANENILKNILDLCEGKEIEVVYVDTMEEIGKACAISREAASACIINSKGKENE